MSDEQGGNSGGEAEVPEPAPDRAEPREREVGGRKGGPEPTRFGDWERNGRCIDF